MCLCQAWGKTGVPNARGFCLVCGEGVWTDRADDAPPPDLTAHDYCRDALGHGCFALDLDGQAHAFTPSVRDRLIERGALYQDADHVWRLRWHGFDLEQERAADMACCDYCSERPVCWLIPCVSFTMPDVPGTPPALSQGDWAACESCGVLIAARDRRGLLARSTAVPTVILAAAIPGLQQALTRVKRDIHQRFWAHYRGGAVRITPRPYGH